MHIKRLAVTIGLAATIFAVVAPAAGANPTGQIEVVLEDALPYVAARHTRNHLHDLHVTLTVRNGQLDGNAWAWSPACPAVEHPAVVTEGKLTADALEVTLTIDVKPVLPKFRGGKGVVTLSLRRDDSQLLGSYDANFVAPTPKELNDWWRSIGGGQRCPATAGLRTHRTHSVLRVPRRFSGAGGNAAQPVVARGAIKFSQPHNGARGGLLMPDAKPPFADDRARPAVKVLTDEPNDPFSLGVAHRVRPGQGSADRAHKAGLANLAALETGWQKRTLTPLTFGRRLAHAAAALDLCGSEWDKKQRDAYAATLVTWARRGMMHRTPESIDDVPPADFLLRQADGAFDTKIAVVRAAQGLAALAAQRAGRPTTDIRDPRVTARRSVHRYAETAFGRSGAPIGQHGLTEALPIIAMYVHAESRHPGAGVAADTGLTRVGKWGWITRGMGIDGKRLSENADWLPAATLLANGTLAGELRGAMEKAAAPASPSTAAMAILAMANVPAGDTPHRPTAAIDRTVKSVVFNDRATGATTLFHAAAVPRIAAGRRGHFTVSALGREWICPPNSPAELHWPTARQSNALQAYRASITSRTGAAPLGAGRLMRVRAFDRGGSVSMLAGGFQQLDEQGKPTGKEIDEDTRIWRTLGVDTSGRCGAEMLLVTVGGATGLKDRHRVWEINVGNIPAEHVSIQGRTFTIAPPDANATLTGTMVYPPTGYITYRPPAEGRQGRIRCAMTPPGKTNEQMLQDSMAAKLNEIRKLAEGVDWEDPNTIELEIEAPFDIPKETTKDPARDQADAQAVLNKLFRHTSSTKMGGGDRFLRAIAGCVVVLTIQTGEAPPVVVAPKDARELLTVGDVGIRYREHLITFEPKTKDAK
ncbi:MAG: hypothetical protein ACOCZU_07795 [Planctomycetota bacterium]